jgi:predicted metal-dependent enzyme (double-stranded beta helix superfamily)
MEIWPAGHYSPIHNHSEANAIIRVLTGQIQVSLFPFLCDEPATVKPFAITEFVQEDITWLSPSLNQVHQLKNTQKSTTCITIQCYMYDGDDTKHYDYFDYLGDNNVKSQYEPDSDMEFLKFKETIRKEWVSHKILNSRPKWWCC